MPAFLAYLPMIMAAAKTVGGLLSKTTDPKRPKPTVPAAATQAVAAAQKQANITVAPGYSTHVETLRKMSQDSIANARRNIKDPQQLQEAIANITNTMRRGASDLQGANESYRVEAMRNLQKQLTALSMHQGKVQERIDEQYMQGKAAKANLFGSAFQDVNTFANQQVMQGSMSEFMQNLTSMFGGGGTTGERRAV